MALAVVSDAVMWGTEIAPDGIVLMVAEADGTPRFARHVGDVDGATLLTVDPEGRAVIGLFAGCNSSSVAKWDLAGNLQWTRTFGGTDCARDGVNILELALDGHDVIVGGNFRGTVDMGLSTPVDVGDQAHGFWMKLAQ